LLKKVLWTESIRARIDDGRPHFMARANLSALVAGTSSAFLEAASTDRPDLVIIGPESIGLSPADLCRRLRGDGRTRSTPILALCATPQEGDLLREAGCTEVLDAMTEPQRLQEHIAGMLGVRLRRHARYPVILPVARGRFFQEFLGYSNSVSEGGMGFDTLARVREAEHLPLRIYRNTEEKPINIVGRVAGVRANIDTGIGYAVGIEFVRLAPADRERLVELFPRDGSVVWGSDAPLPPPTPEG
jgi:CheY-like chemotaxis protein